MKITDYIKNHILYLDGGLGTLLQSKGLKAGEPPEKWNLTHPSIVTEIHKEYFDAGSNVVCMNTFGANSLKYSEKELKEIIFAAFENALKAKMLSKAKGEKWIALDVGPTGRMLAPYGDLDFEEAVSVFKKTVKCGAECGADLIFIETFNDCYETKAAVLAAKEACDLPVFVSNAYDVGGKLVTGATPLAMVAMLEGLGADAIGVNCSFGPKTLKKVVEEYLEYSSLPVILKPNAGLPKVTEGKTVYDVSAEEFSSDVGELVKKGVRIAGGCCGTTPEYIKATADKTSGFVPSPITYKSHALVSSYTHAVDFDEVSPVLIGERINPTGKKKFKEALKAGDIDYILKEGIFEQEKGVHILDVNVGLPEIDEKATLKTAVCELQAIIDLPLQIDTSDFSAMETALRRYNGKAMINSVNGKKESMDAVFPLVKKYGGLVVALTLDENGIPEKAEGRLKIAEKILAYAKTFGIDKKDLIFDPLALTVSADKNAAMETLKAVKLITEMLGCRTSLGVSNVSFGLPERDIITANFFTLALNLGLSAAIMNPYSSEMMKAYRSYMALTGKDDNFKDYIGFVESLPKETAEIKNEKTVNGAPSGKTELQNAIIKGLKDGAAAITKELLREREPLDIVKKEIIPALDDVGAGFEKKSVYLPQLLMSAEASKAAFEEIKSFMKGGRAADKCTFVIATVKGDIHDIGKNIVKLLLENYGFAVTDLGKDVPPEKIVETVVKLHAPVAGLSALMTTTVPAMEKTVKMLKESAPWCKIVVGGAVLNEEYAKSIGADKYAKDGMETVRYAEKVNGSL